MLNMRFPRSLGVGLAVLLSGAAAARAQYLPPPSPGISSYMPAPQAARPGADNVLGLPLAQTPAPESAGAGSTETPSQMTVADPREEQPAKIGPALPEDVKILQDSFLGDWLKPHGARIYGWADFGYTYASTGPGLLSVEPRENRFGNEFLVNQLALVLEKPIKSDELSFGYNATFYAGADAALLRPRGGFTTFDPRFGADFRQLYVSAHLPVLTEGGVDIKAGRMGTIIGYESALAPYRPFYSNDYQWFYAQDGAFTGILATLHVNKQLDVINGVTLGANTFFTLRGQGPCYIGQVNYWLTEEKKTLLSGSVYLGDQAIFAAPGLAGNFDTTVELRLQHDFSKYQTIVLESDMGWDQRIPGIGTGEWYSFYVILINHLGCTLDFNLRAEWFDDVQGTRTGFATNYEELTLGLDYHPQKWLRLRPEIRGDFSNDVPAFGNGRDRAQLTAAIDALFQF
jgi:Putative beta-barrel porin-2, OmpL-like. bbp2